VARLGGYAVSAGFGLAAELELASPGGGEVARRVVVTPSTAIGEVVLLDSVEALLIRPDRF
jgi:hypothetical protein